MGKHAHASVSTAPRKITGHPYRQIVGRKLPLARSSRGEYRPPAHPIFRPQPAGQFPVRGLVRSVLAIRRPLCRACRPAAVLCGSAVFCALAGGCGMVSNTQNSDGVRLFEQAYYQGAQQRFMQSIQSDPSNPDGYYNLARTHHQLGKLHNQPADFQQAESYYHQCLDRDPNRTDCYRALAVLLTDQGRATDAFRLMEGWAARNPSSAAPKIELARLFEESGNRDAAKAQLIDAVTVDPNNARALAALGKLREDAGETMQALANYQRSLALDPSQPQLAQRVAALSTPLVVTPPGGSRVVTAPPAAVTR
jgi:tetratricopeptide (TPR) repeat protein